MVVGCNRSLVIATRRFRFGLRIRCHPPDGTIRLNVEPFVGKLI